MQKPHYPLSEFHYQIYGPPTGRKMVFLHGLMGFLNNWRKIIHYFEEKNCCLSFDQRGHGRSVKPENGYTPDDYAEDLKNILDELGWDKVVLIGHSMGGRNALSFTKKYPERVEKLVVEDIAPSDRNPEGWRYFEGLLGLVPTPFSSRNEAREFFQKEFKSRLSPKENAEMLAAYFYANMEDKPDGTVSWRFSPKAVIETAKAARFQDRWEDVKKISVPTLWIRGGNSETLKSDDFKRVLSMNPLIQGVEIPQSGHWVHAEQPIPFVEAVKNFID